MTGDPPADVARAANELQMVLGQLVRRLRAENTLPLTQAIVLARLERDGAQTTSGLAAAERVRRQSMAQTIRELEAASLVARHSDPLDGRRVLVELTGEGLRALTADRTRREEWIAEAITKQLSRREQDLLVRAVDLLRRLARI